MNALKGLYIWTLTTLLILAGCLGGGVIDEGEGQDSNDNGGTTIINEYINATYVNETYIVANQTLHEPIIRTFQLTANYAPKATVVCKTGTEGGANPEGGLCFGYGLYAFDIDGNITEFGFDIDDDYIVDIPLTLNGSLPIGNVAMSNPIEGENNWENESLWQKYSQADFVYCAKIWNLIATDDSNLTSVEPILATIDWSGC